MESEKIHNRLKKLRESNGLSQTALAKRIGVTPSYVSAMERGEKNITRQVLEKLVELFEVSADWFLTGIDTIRNSEDSRLISNSSYAQSEKSNDFDPKSSRNKSLKIRRDNQPADLESLQNQYAQALSELEAREWRNIDRRLRTVVSHLMLVQELAQELVGVPFDDKEWTALRDASNPPRIQYKRGGEFTNPLNEMSYDEKKRYYEARNEVLERCEAEFDDRFRDLHISLSRPGYINPDARKGTVAALLKGFFEERYKQWYGEDWNE